MEDNLKEGITFKDIFIFLKKSLPIILICVVICCLIGVAICLSIGFANENGGVIGGVIEISYANSGKMPDGSDFDKNEIRSNKIITLALQESGLTKYSATEIKNSLTVSEIIPSNFSDDPTYIPTQFKLLLTIGAVDDLNKEDGKKIVDAIMRVYMQQCDISYFNSDIFDNSVIKTDATKYSAGFIDEQIYAVNEIDRIINYLNNINAYTDLDGYTAESLKVQADVLKNKFNIFIDKVMLNGLVKNAEEKNLVLNYLKSIITNATATINTLTATADEYQTALNSYNKQYPTISGDSTIPMNPSQTFDTWFAKLCSLRAKAEEIKSNNEKYTRWQTDITAATLADATSFSNAESEMKGIMGELELYETRLEKFVKNYNIFEKSENISVVEWGYQDSLLADQPWLATIAICLILGIILGMVVYLAIVKIKAKKAQAKIDNKSVATISDANNNADMENKDSDLDK